MVLYTGAAVIVVAGNVRIGWVLIDPMVVMGDT